MRLCWTFETDAKPQTQSPAERRMPASEMKGMHCRGGRHACCKWGAVHPPLPPVNWRQHSHTHPKLGYPTQR